MRERGRNRRRLGFTDELAEFLYPELKGNTTGSEPVRAGGFTQATAASLPLDGL
jgi:hypothetical protein